MSHYICRISIDADGSIDGSSDVKCAEPAATKHGWCARHEEEARLNRMIALGHDAPKSIAWKDGDEQRIAAKILGNAGIKARHVVEKRLRGKP